MPSARHLGTSAPAFSGVASCLRPPRQHLRRSQRPATTAFITRFTYYTGEGPTLAKLEAFIQNLVVAPKTITPEMLKARFEASNNPEIAANPRLKLPPGPPPPGSFLWNDPRLATLKHKVQFIWGMKDKVNPWEGVLTFRAIPDHEPVLLSKCGHWTQWEQADKFNDIVLSFFARL